MNKPLVSLFTVALLGAAGLAQAQPATYQAGQLVIPTGGIFTDARQQYFTDIVLNADASGRLTIAEATRMPLVLVDDVTAVVDSDEEADITTVTLEVAGNKSVPCVALLPPAVSRKGNTFTVLLAETVQGPAESCIAVIDPFEIEIPLDVEGLAAGSYDVVVNEVEASFELE